MGDKINEACLSVDEDRVFVSFIDGVIRTATREFYRRYKDSIWSCNLATPLSKIPRKGQRLRITNWHDGMPVKIELKEGKTWETIYERDELPEWLHCLANCWKTVGSGQDFSTIQEAIDVINEETPSRKHKVRILPAGPLAAKKRRITRSIRREAE